MAVTRDELLAFMRDELATDVSNLSDSSPLFSSGIVDSFSLASLITFIEKRGGFRMNPEDVNLDNLDSIERILGFVARTQDRARQ